MMSIVLDASAALSLVLPDESSEKVQAFLESSSPDIDLIVPPLWWYECANVLLTAVKRKRLEASEAREALAALWALPVKTDGAPTPVSSAYFFHVGLARDLSAYDAAYLCLAELHGAVFLSLDEGLLKTARQIGIPTAEMG
jgi:predicted nucleic acid-binding protein